MIKNTCWYVLTLGQYDRFQYRCTVFLLSKLICFREVVIASSVYFMLVWLLVKSPVKPTQPRQRRNCCDIRRVCFALWQMPLDPVGQGNYPPILTCLISKESQAKLNAIHGSTENTGYSYFHYKSINLQLSKQNTFGHR